MLAATGINREWSFELLVSSESVQTGSARGIEPPTMNALCRETELIAQSNLNVLIMGETGVGKDVLAQSIHDRSPRSRKPFLRLNCAALTEPLLESELFGHQRGAFTGAMTSKVGLLQTANGGSVLLDELGLEARIVAPERADFVEVVALDADLDGGAELAASWSQDVEADPRQLRAREGAELDRRQDQ